MRTRATVLPTTTRPAASVVVATVVRSAPHPRKVRHNQTERLRVQRLNDCFERLRRALRLPANTSKTTLLLKAAEHVEADLAFTAWAEDDG
jgi:hypothetical protein